MRRNVLAIASIAKFIKILAANDGDGLVRWNGGGDIVEHGRVVVAEMHMLETNVVLLREGSCSLAAERPCSVGIEHAENTEAETAAP